jgi:hypothetical protein
MNVVFSQLDTTFNFMAKNSFTTQSINMLYSKKEKALDYVMVQFKEMNSTCIDGCMVLQYYSDEEIALMSEMILQATCEKFNLVNLKGM